MALVLVRTRRPLDGFLIFFFVVRVDGGVGKLRSPVREESGFLFEENGVNVVRASVREVLDDLGTTGV